MINLYIANERSEIELYDESLEISDIIKDKLYEMEKNNEIGEGFAILAKLDRYGCECLNTDEIESVISDIETKIPLEDIHQYVAKFLREFIVFGRRAISENTGIVAIGD